MVGVHRPRGSGSRSDMDSMASGAPRRGLDRRSDNDSMAGGPPPRGSGSPSDMDSMAGGPPRRGLGGRTDDDSSESFDEIDHGAGNLAPDPHQTGKQADTSMSLDPKRDRYLIILQNDATPYACGPTNLDVHWVKPGIERYTIGVGKPEYCSSVIEGIGLGRQPVTKWTVPDVAEARQLLAAASVESRTLVLQAMQKTVEELLSY